MELIIKMEVNGNPITKHKRIFDNLDDFFNRFVFKRLMEDFNIIFYDDKNNFLSLQKEKIILRCWW